MRINKRTQFGARDGVFVYVYFPCFFRGDLECAFNLLTSTFFCSFYHTFFLRLFVAGFLGERVYWCREGFLHLNPTWGLRFIEFFFDECVRYKRWVRFASVVCCATHLLCFLSSRNRITFISSIIWDVRQIKAGDQQVHILTASAADILLFRVSHKLNL